MTIERKMRGILLAAGVGLAAAAIMTAAANAQDSTSNIPSDPGNITIECSGIADCSPDKHYLFVGVTFQTRGENDTDLARIAQRAAKFGRIHQDEEEENQFLQLVDGKKSDDLFKFLCGLPDRPEYTSDIEIHALPEEYRFSSRKDQNLFEVTINLNFIKRLGAVRCNFVN